MLPAINPSASTLSIIEQRTKEREEQTEKLASALRINSAADDAAGLQIANRLTTDINQNQQLSINVQDQINLNDVQAGALSTINDSLQRASVLSIQSANPLYDNSAIQGELNQLTEQINVIASEVLGQDDFLATLDAGDPATTQATLENALTTISDSATEIGANSNALASQAITYETSVVNVSASRTRIQDTDFANVTAEQQKTEILLQAAIISKNDEESRKGLLINKLI